MKSKRKAMLLVLCAVLLVAASVLGTMAYLTATDTVTNTFTVGQVKIKLDEAKTDALGTGTPVVPAARTEDGNSYYLLPGNSYTKDPTVTNTGNNDAWIRVNVTLTNWPAISAQFGASFKLSDIFTDHDEVKWSLTGTPKVGTGTITYSYYYHEILEEGENTGPLFKTITIPGTFEAKIIIAADAIQADGFTSATAAFAAFDAQTTTP